jgi:hypothetical protein
MEAYNLKVEMDWTDITKMNLSERVLKFIWDIS